MDTNGRALGPAHTDAHAGWMAEQPPDWPEGGRMDDHMFRVRSSFCRCARHPSSRGSVIRRTCLRLFAAAILAGLLGACAAPQTRQLEMAPPPELSRAAELERVPFLPQERFQCGPAALATVLADLGFDMDAEALVGEVYLPARAGSLQSEMRAAARARGLVSYPLAPALADLLAEIDAGRPVLVLQNLGLGWSPTWHYAVAVGYDLDAGEVILRSGTTRRRVTDMNAFERTWARADRWAQVVVYPGDIPATARPLAWLETVHEFEQTDLEHEAVIGYHAAVERWPGFRPAWMALGNGAYIAGDFVDAGAAFLHAVELEPDAWHGWNNLALALDATGCHSGAARAATCAVALAPRSTTALETLHNLADAVQHSTLTCPPVPACPVE